LLQIAHALVTLSTAPLDVVALHSTKALDRSSSAWAGFLGAALATFGSLARAADKGALAELAVPTTGSAGYARPKAASRAPRSRSSRALRCSGWTDWRSLTDQGCRQRRRRSPSEV
jgi:hypothetical protein